MARRFERADAYWAFSFSNQKSCPASSDEACGRSSKMRRFAELRCSVRRGLFVQKAAEREREKGVQKATINKLQLCVWMSYELIKKVSYANAQL